MKLRWPDVLTYCPRGMTRAEWREEFNRVHKPRYDAAIAECEAKMRRATKLRDDPRDDLVLKLYVGLVAAAVMFFLAVNFLQ